MGSLHQYQFASLRKDAQRDQEYLAREAHYLQSIATADRWNTDIKADDPRNLFRLLEIFRNTLTLVKTIEFFVWFWYNFWDRHNRTTYHVKRKENWIRLITFILSMGSRSKKCLLVLKIFWQNLSILQLLKKKRKCFAVKNGTEIFSN